MKKLILILSFILCLISVYSQSNKVIDTTTCGVHLSGLLTSIDFIQPTATDSSNCVWNIMFIGELVEYKLNLTLAQKMVSVKEYCSVTKTVSLSTISSTLKRKNLDYKSIIIFR
jgi:hypothetical protein